MDHLSRCVCLLEGFLLDKGFLIWPQNQAQKTIKRKECKVAKSKQKIPSPSGENTDTLISYTFYPFVPQDIGYCKHCCCYWDCKREAAVVPAANMKMSPLTFVMICLPSWRLKLLGMCTWLSNLEHMPVLEMCISVASLQPNWSHSVQSPSLIAMGFRQWASNIVTNVQASPGIILTM